MSDTIVATSSGRPPAAIAIVRVSGQASASVVSSLAGRLPTPRRATLRALRDRDGALLDRALLLWFPAPATATGEDVAEFHVHGGRAVIEAVEAAILTVPGVRRAEPGEFTRRALLSGRIDLTQAEGLADLLAAETEGQRRAAIANAEGALGGLIRDWLTRLSALRAVIEAAIDFDDEADVPPIGPAFADEARALLADMTAVMERPSVERLTLGFRVVIAGPPNAGKSALFNALLQREAAIVAPIAGTTRDRIEASARRDGVAFALSDTAGLADTTDDPIERIGIERTRAAIDEADLILWLSDDPPPRSGALWLRGKADLPERAAPLAGQWGAVSAFEPIGVERLWGEVARQAGVVNTVDFALHEHQHLAVADAIHRLEAAVGHCDPLLVAEEFRAATIPLAGLLGINATEAMLAALFGRFCIGK